MRLLLLALMLGMTACGQQVATPFRWPDGKRAALSLSFDDARASQVDVGMAVLDRYGVKATFYVLPAGVARRLDGWRKAVAAGHEIGNHSLNHPCTGSFPWAREHALEGYTLESMRHELVESNRRIKELLAVTPESFSYPCGQTFVGRGLDTVSYVPLVTRLFVSGRVWHGEWPNDPGFCDLAQLNGIKMDGEDFEGILPLLEEATKAGYWIVLAGHEIGEKGPETTSLTMLEKLLAYARDPASGLWLAPVGTVAEYVREQRKDRRRPLVLGSAQRSVGSPRPSSRSA